MLDFWVDPGPKYGSLNFDQNALTDTGQSIISQLLWDLDRWYIYQIKGIWKGFLGKWLRKQWNNNKVFKNNINTFQPQPFKKWIFNFFYFL